MLFSDRIEKERVQKTKRLKHHMSQSPFADLICPITLHLPYDPVVAGDGQIYERLAIIQHFEEHGESSPLTKNVMGVKLIPAVQIRNHIETCVRNGVITGDLANKWKKQEKENEMIEAGALMKKALGGDHEAMFLLGIFLFDGLNGFGKDQKIAFDWYERAANAGNVKALALSGFSYMNGSGVKENVTYGIALVTMAAERGSDLACLSLGLWLAGGDFDLVKDRSRAIHFLSLGLSGLCPHRHARREPKEEANLMLTKLTKLDIVSSNAKNAKGHVVGNINQSLPLCKIG
eukprot:scaffold79653_cov49-Attheya_sp.AAC.3